MAIGTLFTPESNGKCGGSCSGGCDGVVCSCDSSAKTFTVYSDNNFELTQAEKDMLDQECGFMGHVQVSAVDEQGNPITDPSLCDQVDPNNPNIISRVACYSCYGG